MQNEGIIRLFKVLTMSNFVHLIINFKYFINIPTSTMREFNKIRN